MHASPRIQIAPEYSAQSRGAPPSPALQPALTALGDRIGRLRGLRIADHGCGKLRHYQTLLKISRQLFLVDTESQLTTTHRDGDRAFTVEEVARSENGRRGRDAVVVLRDAEFAKSRLSLDAVFSIAVCDVVPDSAREVILAIGAANLKRHGWFVLIVPRNDSSILSRCAESNRYKDGYVFAHHGVHTFYRNFRSHDALIGACRRNGLELDLDLSTYRQVSLILKRVN